MNYVIIIDDEYVTEWDAETFALSDIVGAEMPDEKSDTCAERTIDVFVNPTYCDHSSGECGHNILHEDEERVIVDYEAKQSFVATVTTDGDGEIITVEEVLPQ